MKEIENMKKLEAGDIVTRYYKGKDNYTKYKVKSSKPIHEIKLEIIEDKGGPDMNDFQPGEIHIISGDIDKPIDGEGYFIEQ